MFYSQEIDVSNLERAQGLSGMGQLLPGIRPQTTQMVIIGSAALVLGAALLFLATRKKPQGGSNAVK